MQYLTRVSSAAACRWPGSYLPRRLRPLALLALVVGLGCQEAELPSAPAAAPPPTLDTAAATIEFRSISAGDFHTCGPKLSNAAYCWGANESGARQQRARKRG